MKAVAQIDTDSLSNLEDRILRAVELVSQLRRENAILAKEKEEAIASHRAALDESAGHKAEAERLATDIETIRGEQKQVRTRLEKLLELIDSVGA